MRSITQKFSFNAFFYSSLLKSTHHKTVIYFATKSGEAGRDNDQLPGARRDQDLFSIDYGDNNLFVPISPLHIQERH